jgi:hypothetical protein
MHIHNPFMNNVDFEYTYLSGLIFYVRTSGRYHFKLVDISCNR